MWVEVRDATKPAILSGAVPTKKNQQAPSVAVEKSKKDIQRPALKAEHLCYRRNIASTCPSPVSEVGLHSSPSILPHAPLGFCHSLANSMLAIVNRAALNGHTVFLWYSGFVSCDYSISKIARSRDRSTFSFVRTSSVFSITAVLTCIVGNSD